MTDKEKIKVLAIALDRQEALKDAISAIEKAGKSWKRAEEIKSELVGMMGDEAGRFFEALGSPKTLCTQLVHLTAAVGLDEVLRQGGRPQPGFANQITADAVVTEIETRHKMALKTLERLP